MASSAGSASNVASLVALSQSSGVYVPGRLPPSVVTMPRKPAEQKSRNPTRGATPARDYEIGDEVFFSFAGTAGEGLFIGQLREDATCLVLARSAELVIEMPGAYCSP